MSPASCYVPSTGISLNVEATFLAEGYPFSSSKSPILAPQHSGFELFQHVGP